MRAGLLIALLFAVFAISWAWKASVHKGLQESVMNFYATKSKLAIISGLKKDWGRQDLSRLQDAITTSFGEHVKFSEKSKTALKIELLNLGEERLKNAAQQVFKGHYQIAEFEFIKDSNKSASFSFRLVQ